MKLKYPLKEKNEKGQDIEITEVTIHRMKAKHLKLIPKRIYETKGGRKKNDAIDPELLFPLIASLTGLEEEQLDEIDMIDLLPIIDEVMKLVGEALDQTL